MSDLLDELNEELNEAKETWNIIQWSGPQKGYYTSILTFRSEQDAKKALKALVANKVENPELLDVKQW